MKNSGELSHAAFAFLVERWCLKPDTLSVFAIDVYGRFKDDIVIVARNRNLTKHFVWCMKHRSKYYKIKEEEISDMLSSLWKSCAKRWISIRHRPRIQANKSVATVGNRQCSCSPLPHVVALCAPHHVQCVVGKSFHFPQSQRGVDQQVYLARRA